jgi:hypothetical protein
VSEAALTRCLAKVRVDEAELVARIETALQLKHTVDRRLGAFRALKDQVAQLVHLVTPRDSPAS